VCDNAGGGSGGRGVEFPVGNAGRGVGGGGGGGQGAVHGGLRSATPGSQRI